MKRTLLPLIAGTVGLLLADRAALAQGQGQVGNLNYATPYDFVTIAGTAGSVGTNDAANAAARFHYPEGLTVDTNGNVYVVDSYENTVRKLTRSGTNWVASTIAGTPGVTGSTDGAGSKALFNAPVGIAADRSGNLFVVDGNSTVRKLTFTAGNWQSSTIAGAAGLIGTDDGSNGVSRFAYPNGIATDVAGNVYVADTLNFDIRQVSPSGTNWIVTTIAGNSSAPGSQDGTNQDASFNSPNGLAVDGSGNIFVADGLNDTVREITPVGTNWVVTTIAGTPSNAGGAVDDTNGAAAFNNFFGIAVDTNDNVYLTDYYNNLIRKVSPVGTNWVTTTLAGAPDLSAGSTNGVGTNAAFNGPWGIAVDAAGNLFVADTDNSVIRMGTLAVLSLPDLTISLAPGNAVTVSWPAVGGTLQTNSDLSTTNWAAFGGTNPPVNGTNSATISSPPGTLFFRLAN
jgi:hypothetical protein